MTSIFIEVKLEQNLLFTATIPQDLYFDIQTGFATAGLPQPGDSVELPVVKDRIRYVYDVHQGLRPIPDTGASFTNPSGYQLPKGLSVTNERVSGSRPILFLLESPHVDEVMLRQPAAGSTGEMIDQHLHGLYKLITEVSQPGDDLHDSPLILVNPCRYPTSCLAEVTRWPAWRDHVFDRAMSRWDVQHHFYMRLHAYNPRLIINACTGARSSMKTQWPLNRGAVAHIETPKPQGIVRTLLALKYGSTARYHYHSFDPGTGQFPNYLPPTGTDSPVVDIVEVHHPIQWLHELEKYQQELSDFTLSLSQQARVRSRSRRLN